MSERTNETAAAVTIQEFIKALNASPAFKRATDRLNEIVVFCNNQGIRLTERQREVMDRARFAATIQEDEGVRQMALALRMEADPATALAGLSQAVAGPAADSPTGKWLVLGWAGGYVEIGGGRRMPEWQRVGAVCTSLADAFDLQEREELAEQERREKNGPRVAVGYLKFEVAPVLAEFDEDPQEGEWDELPDDLRTLAEEKLSAMIDAREAGGPNEDIEGALVDAMDDLGLDVFKSAATDGNAREFLLVKLPKGGE